jgi:hypothetical protein
LWSDNKLLVTGSSPVEPTILMKTNTIQTVKGYLKAKLATELSWDMSLNINTIQNRIVNLFEIILIGTIILFILSAFL